MSAAGRAPFRWTGYCHGCGRFDREVETRYEHAAKTLCDDCAGREIETAAPQRSSGGSWVQGANASALTAVEVDYFTANRALRKRKSPTPCEGPVAPCDTPAARPIETLTSREISVALSFARLLAERLRAGNTRDVPYSTRRAASDAQALDPAGRPQAKIGSRILRRLVDAGVLLPRDPLPARVLDGSRLPGTAVFAPGPLLAAVVEAAAGAVEEQAHAVSDVPVLGAQPVVGERRLAAAVGPAGAGGGWTHTRSVALRSADEEEKE
jgi:hypothetical protein